MRGLHSRGIWDKAQRVGVNTAIRKLRVKGTTPQMNVFPPGIEARDSTAGYRTGPGFNGVRPRVKVFSDQPAGIAPLRSTLRR